MKILLTQIMYEKKCICTAAVEHDRDPEIHDQQYYDREVFTNPGQLRKDCQGSESRDGRSV